MDDNATQVTARWKGGLSFEGVNARGVPVRMDPPAETPYLSPMELVLVALAGCTGMDVADILRKKRQIPETMEIRARGTRAAEHPKVYTAIELEYVFTGADLTAEAAARSIELSVDKYCSVYGMLIKAVPIRTSFRIEPGSGGRP
jgi:putative redox protein